MTNATPLSDINQYLTTIIDIGASDLHLSSECFPLARLHGGLVRLDDRLLGAHEVADYARHLLDDDDWAKLPERKNLDFAYETQIHDLSHRFRCNVYIQGLGLSIVMRVIPTSIPSWQECGLPPSVVQMTRHHQGLVLVTGPAGCGKTTTLASLIRHINEHKRVHVITVEDPIEYVHECKKALIHQRQVGMDVDSFQTALKGALREDPDVVFIGELRDLETTQLAITAAETGHLVLSTMHTNSAAKTVDRLIDAFPVDQQPQIRLMISESLKGIIAQQLVPRVDGEGRVLACEVLHVIPSIANMIRDGRTFQITGVLQTSHSLGMCSMDEALAELLHNGVIDEHECRARMIDQTLLETLAAPKRRSPHLK
jgi:twitching motility protein PilT